MDTQSCRNRRQWKRRQTSQGNLSYIISHENKISSFWSKPYGNKKLSGYQQLDTKFASRDQILHSIQVDSPPEFLFVRRREQICITRIMLRTCRLTHSHYFLKISPPFCTSCNAPKHLGHIFIICPLYNSQRQIMIAYCIQNNLSFCMQSLFSLKCPSDIIIQFLKNTDNLNQI